MQVKRGELGGGGPAGARGPGPCLLPRVASTPGWSMWKAMAFRPGQAPPGAPAGWTLSTSSLPHSTGAHPGGLPHDVPQPLVCLRDGGQRTGPGGEPAIPGLSGGRHPGSASGRLEGGGGDREGRAQGRGTPGAALGAGFALIPPSTEHEEGRWLTVGLCCSRVDLEFLPTTQSGRLVSASCCFLCSGRTVLTLAGGQVLVCLAAGWTTARVLGSGGCLPRFPTLSRVSSLVLSKARSVQTQPGPLAAGPSAPQGGTCSEGPGELVKFRC